MLASSQRRLCNPRWSPDGQRLAYSRIAHDKDDGIYIQQADGSGLPQLVLKIESLAGAFLPAVLGARRLRSHRQKDSNGKWDLLFVPLAADGKPGTPRDLRVTSYNEGWRILLP